MRPPSCWVLRSLGPRAPCSTASGRLRSHGTRSPPADSLTPFAWVFRCPGEPEELSLDEAVEALAIARDLCRLSGAED
jgi:hypothetical protein